MFKNLEKEMRRLAARQSISVPLEGDAEGYFDKECPDNNCLFQFKIYGQDWKDIVRDEEVFCPSCRHCAPSNSWYTTEQLAGARRCGRLQSAPGTEFVFQHHAQGKGRA